MIFSLLRSGIVRLGCCYCRSAVMSSKPIVFSGPSGAGKSTLIERLMSEFDGCFAFSVSHTTRNPRPGEQNGIAYHFVTRDEMTNAIKHNEFVEHAEFSGNLYGTSKKTIDNITSSGKICLLDVEIQGVKNIKKSDIKAIYIFIQPPDLQELEKRLRARGTETEDSLAKRLATAKEAMDYAAQPGSYDHIVINSNLDDAYKQLRDILMPDIKEVLKLQKK